MPRMALRLYPDEREDIRKLRVVLRKAEDPPLDWRLRAVQILSEWTSIEQTAGMCQQEAMGDTGRFLSKVRRILNS